MGATFSASACIGVRIPHDKVYTVRKVKTFAHDFPDDWTHDPKTGRELWRNASVCTIKNEGDEKLVYDGTFSVLEDGDSESGGDFVYVTRLHTENCCIGEGDEPEGIPIADETLIGRDRVALKKLLTPGGLWRDEWFGLWVIPYVSC